MNAAELARCAALDRRLLAAVREIRILSTVAWPASQEQALIDAYARGTLTLPYVTYRRPDLGPARAELDAIEREAGTDGPLADYLRRNAASWRVAATLLEAVGSEAVTAPSIALYGRPDDRIPGSDSTNLDAARHFVALANELGGELAAGEAQGELGAETLRDELVQALDAFFGPGIVRVEVDPELTAKAAAGATRIRLRSGASFTTYDRHQLLAHEAFVHTLTALNGRAQPHLASLARTSPRVTATQEGLAVFAEVISGSMDIARLKRISLRIIAIDMALRGADFIEVLRFFIGEGQGVADSFHSTQRIFRGVPTGGGAAFTKDNVYLHGLLTVHTFFRWALANRRLDMMRQLFAGKLALTDVADLQPLFAAGVIAPPRYLPPWMRQTHGLAGKLAFSLFVNRIRMDRFDLPERLPGRR